MHRTLPVGLPRGHFLQRQAQSFPQPQPPPNQHAPEQEQISNRSIAYLADYSGCGHWRCIWPDAVINAHTKGVIHETTMMVLDERYYANTRTVRIQRQATDYQREFVKFLKQIQPKYNFKIVYEIDDVVFAEDIPDYNKFKSAFTDPKIRECAQDIMAMSDEITVTCQFMKDYYEHKTGNKNITVIPNYPPKFWMGSYYDEERIKKLYRKHCDGRGKRPRVLYPGSGAHFDVDNRVNQNDDFAHVRDTVAKTVKDIQWVFLGAYPLPLKPLIDQGLIEFHSWSRLLEYPKSIYDIAPNFIVAPLQDNTFNKCKSDLKYIEAACYGVPAICQDIDTYANAPLRFTTGDEMIDQIKTLSLKSHLYMKESREAYKVAETRWLEKDENIDKWVELYQHHKGSPERKLLV